MRFYRNVPDSLRNKNVERYMPYLLKKMAFKTPPWAHGKKHFCQLQTLWSANGKEWMYKIWWTCRHRSQLQDLTIRSTKESPNFAQFTLLSVGAILRLFWKKMPLELYRLKTCADIKRNYYWILYLWWLSSNPICQ